MSCLRKQSNKFSKLMMSLCFVNAITLRYAVFGRPIYLLDRLVLLARRSAVMSISYLKIHKIQQISHLHIVAKSRRIICKQKRKSCISSTGSVSYKTKSWFLTFGGHSSSSCLQIYARLNRTFAILWNN